MKHFLFILAFILVVKTTNAQKNILSEQAEISVLTIGPGSSLNDAFGHSGFRVKDPIKGTDLVFNYGVYDFETPNFYTKFAQGRLNYLIGLNYFEDFFEIYISENRTIKEQVLNLTPTQKQTLFNYLIDNMEPENRAYLYDFFFDNCATKIKDVTNIALNNNIEFNIPEGFQQKTFRTLIQENLNPNSWGSLGIDVALGSVIDRKATPEQYMFLPENIHRFFNNAIIKTTNQPLVKKSRVLFEKIESPKSKSFFSSPLFVFSIMAFIILWVTFSDYKNKKQSTWLDIILFSITGIIGIVILLLWFATDHKGTHQNYNLLWAFALNILVIGQLFKKRVKSWFIKYLKFLIIMLCLMAFHWIIGVQVFAVSLIPFLIALGVRYIYLINFCKSI